MPTRLVRIAPEHRLETLARHVAGLQAERSVLVVTTQSTASQLRRVFAQHGVDLGHVYIVDCIGSLSGALRSDDPHLMHVDGPHQFELNALRALDVVQTETRRIPHVLVWTGNSLAPLDSPDALEKAVQHMAQSLVHPQAMLEVFLVEGEPIPRDLLRFLQSSMEESVRLAPLPVAMA